MMFPFIGIQRLFGHLGTAQQAIDTLSPYKVDTVNMLAKNCLFMHTSDIEQH